MNHRQELAHILSWLMPTLMYWGRDVISNRKVEGVYWIGMCFELKCVLITEIFLPSTPWGLVVSTLLRKRKHSVAEEGASLFSTFLFSVVPLLFSIEIRAITLEY